MDAMSSENRIYVGNIPTGYLETDIKDIFDKYGEIVNIDLKNKRGPPHFAFVEYGDARDAEDAVRGRDGYKVGGHTLHVEFTRGGGRGGPPRGPPPPGGVTRRGGISGTPAFRGIGFRVYVSGLPPTGSWQDLKDHMRQAGDVCSADVDRSRDGTGWCEFVRKEDAKYAVKKLDDTKFRSHKGETSYVRVFMDEADAKGSNNRRSRSRSRHTRRSRSPRVRGAARSSPTYSPLGRRSRSGSSRSRSVSRSTRSRSSSNSGSSRTGTDRSTSPAAKKHKKSSRRHRKSSRHKKSSSRRRSRRSKSRSASSGARRRSRS